MIKELSSIRFLLLTLIFIHHMPPHIWQGGGNLAVTGFFILGGVCTTLGYVDKIEDSQFSYSRYLKTRLLKLYPFHWICLVIVLGRFLFSGTSKFSFDQFVCNALLLQSWIPDENFYFSFNTPTWYISDCIIFIFIFPYVAVKIKRLLPLHRVALVITLALICGILYSVIPESARRWGLYISPIVRSFDFLLGIVLGLFLMSPNAKKLGTFVHSHKYIAESIFGVTLSIMILISISLPSRLHLLSPLYWIGFCILLTISSLIGGGVFCQEKYLFY